MKIYYDEKADLLYIRFDEEKREIVNKRVTEDIVLDMEDEDKIIGIEILDASKHINLAKVLPIYYELQQRESVKSKT
jgi:Uncharacterized conserved small protein